VNYAASANREAGEARQCLSLTVQEDDPELTQILLAEAQVHATLANAYATLAVYTETGGRE
jgi:hypothetical protein